MINSDPYLCLIAHKGDGASAVAVFNNSRGKHQLSEVVDRFPIHDRAALAEVFARRRAQPVQVLDDYTPKNWVTSLTGISDLALAASKSIYFYCCWYSSLKQVKFGWRGPIHLRTGKCKSGGEMLPIDTPDSYFIDRIHEVVEKFKKEIGCQAIGTSNGGSMGVDYHHEIVVSDPDWMPDAGTMTRVLAVLSRHGLCSPSAGSARAILGTEPDPRRVYSLGSDPREGALWEIRSPEGEGFEAVFGGPFQPLEIAVVVGTDLRIPSFSEESCAEVLTPPMRGEEEIEPRGTEDSPPSSLFFQSFPGTGRIVPPEVVMQVEDERCDYQPVVIPGFWQRILRLARVRAVKGQEPKPFPGFWRGGVLIDFDQGIPDFENEDRRIPNAAFMRDLSAAFRAPLAERGYLN